MAVGVALPFGHIHSDALAALTRLAGTYGVHSVRLAPGRALLLLGVAAENADALAHEAAETPGYELISGAIKTGARLAIWLSERI